MSASITPESLQDRLHSELPPRLLDVREPEEYQFAQLADALLIPLAELPGRLTELQDWREGDIVVYCHHGIRSLHAIHFLESKSFSHLFNLTGGIDQWSLKVDPSLPRY